MSIHLIDTNAWWGPWPFAVGRADRSVGELARELKREGIGRAWVSPLAAVWVDDPMPANRDLMKRLEGGRVLSALPILNPALVGWEEDLVELARSPNVTAVRWLPAYHNFRLTSTRAREAAAAVERAGLRLVVTVRLVDERHEHHAVRLKPVPVKALLAWLPALKRAPLVQGLTRHEIGDVAAAGARNFLVDTSFAEWRDTLAVVRQSLPLTRVMFGTLTPLHVTAAQVAKIAGSSIGGRERQAVGAGNAEKFFG